MTNFFNRLNTHMIFGVGAGSFILGIGAMFLQHPIDSVIAAHTSVGVQAVVLPQVNQWLTSLALPAVIAGGALLGQGRPPSVPSGPVKGSS